MCNVGREEPYTCQNADSLMDFMPIRICNEHTVQSDIADGCNIKHKREIFISIKVIKLQTI